MSKESNGSLIKRVGAFEDSLQSIEALYKNGTISKKEAIKLEQRSANRMPLDFVLQYYEAGSLSDAHNVIVEHWTNM